MTPGARVQAAIEILDLVIAAARANGAPADRIVGEWFRTRRFAGSKDRRAVRDLVYAAIRACGPVPISGRAAMLRLAQDDPSLAGLFDGQGHAPAPIAAEEPVAAGGVAPPWLERALAESDISGDQAQALLARAPLDLRVNTLKADRATLALPQPGEPGLAPQSLRLPHGTQVESWEAYTTGQIEVQDIGSQLVCAALGAQPGELVIDLCAGAGGKTLALAAAMDNRGRLIATDTDRARLSRLEPRAWRAGVTIAETRLLDPGREAEALADLAGQADAVLVDAPCSGTGTWRRSPEGRWRLTPDQLARYAAVQARLLDLAASLLRPDGRLGFVTCSLLDVEGAGQAAGFLARHPDWSAQELHLAAGTSRGPGVRLAPGRDGTDGFFVACFRKT
ncbi:RsmB/NOP family class I SAM-dependent RNA methyltransferase [Novosphingobium ginsenosidimutans]|uniref:RsmB/NOP family class I SAM-dependent RNA methyltransferase n=1 Tax=Novosphingobium ginsenosidimutans TaxID=1176536 RepID=A0A5B8S4X3_9SPHN|nr:RsmB/NOP family class I SAM-dependent RNA methyltransferase [Novosphingobium ginsenosidimutans]QEA16561.1 RsmB/NOP family class I SAM-dependent RNA methyltransferase [Novosphingobium ginsenosidimutans]